MLRLLRAVLREHRRLPAEMRRLGDMYVMKEFRDHQKVTDPAQLARFQRGWEAYLADIQMQGSRFGADLPGEVIDSMSDDQRQKLIDLRQYSQTETGPKNIQ